MAAGASVAGNMMARNPNLSAEYKFVPGAIRRTSSATGKGVNTRTGRLKVDEIIAAANGMRGRLDQDGAEVASGDPAGEGCSSQPLRVAGRPTNDLKDERL